MCTASLSIPSEWFLHSEPVASATVQVRLLSSFNQQSLGNVMVNARQTLSFTNDIAFQVPSRPLHVLDTFSVPVYGHATYAIAAYGIRCRVGDSLAFEGIDLDTSTWISEVRPVSIPGAKDTGVVAILRSPEAAVEAVMEQRQLLLSFRVQVLSSAMAGTTETINCTTSYLSSIYNEKIMPRGQVTPAPSLPLGSTVRPGTGEVRIVADTPRGLFSYADQSQAINTAVLTGNPVIVPITHVMALSSGRVVEALNVHCNTTSRAFHLSSDCSSYVLNGNETSGARADSILTSYLDLASEVLVRVWFPSSQTTLQSTPAVIRPVTQWLSVNSTNECVQRYQPASLRATVDYSYDSNSPTVRASVLPLVASLVRSSNPAVISVSENGQTLVAISPGISNISAGPFIIPLQISVLPDPLNVTSLDVTLFSGMSVSLVDHPYPILSSQTAIANIQQIFHSISSDVFFSVIALLNDGSTLLLDDSTEVIRVRSVNSDVVSVSNGSISLLGGGRGDLLEVTWLSPCTGFPIAAGNGSADIRVPDPVRLDVQQSNHRITYPGDTSRVGEIPASLNLSVFLVFPDGLQRDVTNDTQTSYAIQQGADLVTLTFSDASLVITTPLNSSGGVFGRVEMLITYGRFSIFSNVSFDVVVYHGLRLSSTPHPLYPGSTSIAKSTVFQIEQTGQYQQVALVLEGLLSDNSTIQVTQSPLAFYRSPSATINGNIVSVTAPGSYLIEGLLGSDAARHTIEAVSDSIVISSLNGFSIPTITDSFTGARGDTRFLNLNVTFSDSTQYISFIPLATNIFPHVLSLTGNTPSAVSINPLSGQVTLQRNHHSLVTVTVATMGPTSLQEQISFACNLLPAMGDVDLGQPEDIPVPEVTLGTNFSVPLSVNSGNLSFTSISFTISYNTNLEILSVRTSENWSGDLQYNTDTPGIIHVTATSSGTVSSGLVHLLDLTFQAVTEGVGSLGGVITQTSLGGTVPRTFIAGQVEVNILPARTRRSVLFESVARTRRNAGCNIAPCASCPGARPTGDTNGDCSFNFSDVQFLMMFLVEDLFGFGLSSGASLQSLILPTQVEEFDADLNSAQDLQDAYFLHQVQSGLLYFLRYVVVNPVQESSTCQLVINATLLGSGDVLPNSSLLDVYFDIGLAFDPSFTSQSLFDDSHLVKGSLMSTVSKGLALPGGILRAEALEPGVFGIIMETNLTMENIGLSVIQASSPNRLSSSQARTRGMFGAPDPPYLYNSQLLLSLPIFSDFTEIRTSVGYSPLTTFNNTMTTLACITPPPPPVLSQALVQATIPENISLGVPVVSISAQSQSDLPVTYSVSAGNTGNRFEIDATDGTVRVIQSLDFEMVSNYTLIIAATDSATGFSSTATAEITVTDINDNVPMFTAIPSNISIPANSPIGSVIVASIEASDADEGSNAVIIYSIHPANTFSIDMTTGIITVQQALNFDVQNIYILTITARDLGTPSLASSSNFTVNVLPPDPTVLQFSSSIYNATIAENSPTESPVVQVFASPVTTQPTDIPLLVDYSLDTPEVPFFLDSLTGQLSVNGTIDREEIASYTVEISAMLSDVARSIPALTVVLIRVSDLNDNAPVFTATEYRAMVIEGSPPGEITMVAANDLDEGNNRVVVYSLPENVTQFVVEYFSGVISSTERLDYEANTVIELLVMATDLGVPPLFSTSEVLVNVIDINDNAPVLSILPTVALLPESQQINSIIAMIEITDADSPSTNGNINLSILDITTGNDSQVISIGRVSSNTTGGNGTISAEVVLARSLDYETQSLYRFVVAVSDSGDPQISSNATFDVNVTDVNDNAPIFTMTTEYNFTVREDINVPFVLASLTASDADSGSNGEVEFLLSSSTPSTNQFNITLDGVLLIVESLDYEVVQLYELIATVMNVAPGSPNSTATINIHVTNVNEFAPAFTETVYQASFLEEVAGVFVAQTTALDMDLTDSVVYSINSENFVVDMNGTIRTSRPIDREVLSVYNISVSATDSNADMPLSSTATVIASVQDINDNSPIFYPFQNISILQSTSVGTTVATFSASDADVGSNSEIGSFFVSPPVPQFSLSSDGQLSIASSLGATSTTEYVLTIVATDRGIPPLNSTAVFSILIEQLPVPIFSESQYNFSVFEGNSIGTVLGQIEAFTLNPDALIVSYLLLTTSLSGVFEVGMDSGNITAVVILDREREVKYIFEVVAIASLDSMLYNSTTMVTVNVLDINDNLPVFDISSPALARLNETVPSGTFVASYSASDQDLGNNAIIEYAIVSGNDILQLEIDSSGTLTTTQGLVDQTGIYNLIVTASNPADFGPLMTTAANLTVEVLPVNMFTPIFDRSRFAVDILEDANLKSEVIMLVANDSDLGSAGLVLYSITNVLGFSTEFSMEGSVQLVNSDNVFAIDNTTGTIRLQSTIDYENATTYTITVQAKDSGMPSRSSTTSVNVRVVDINDNPPIFTQSLYVGSIDENEQPGQSILRVAVTDEDSGANSAVNFTILLSSIGDFFTITPGGILETTLPIDRETHSRASLTIMATNFGTNVTLTATSMVEVTINDLNDNAPEFGEAVYFRTLQAPVLENATILQVNAVDHDSSANNSILQFHLSNNTSQFFIATDSGTIQSAIEFRNGINFTLTVTATDNGVPRMSSQAQVNIFILAPDDLTINRERDITFNTTGSANLFGLPIELAPTMYQQMFGFSISPDGPQQHTVTAQLGSLMSSISVSPVALAAVDVRSAIAYDEIWPDLPQVAFSVQVRDRTHNVQARTTVHVQSTHPQLGNVSSTCITTSFNGLCQVNLNIPDFWFENEINVTASVGLSQSSLQIIKSVQLQARPVFSSSSTSYVYMAMPLRPLFRGNTFSVPVYGRTGSRGVGSYTATVQGSSGVDLTGLTFDSSLWVAETQTGPSGDISITSVLSDQTTELAPGETLLFTISATVSSQSREDAVITSALTVTVRELNDFNRVRLLPPSGMASILSSALFRDGVTDSGSIFVASDPVVDIFPFVQRAELTNTAVLNALTISEPILIMGIHRSGGIAAVSETSRLSCSSGSPSVVSVGTSCSSIALTTAQTEASVTSAINIMYNDISASFPVRIWIPVNVDLVVADDILQLLPSIPSSAANCMPTIQSTSVRGFANITNGVEYLANIDVTQLIQPFSSNSAVVEVRSNVLLGTSPGTTRISGMPAGGSVMFNEVIVSVVSESVELVGLDVRVLTGLQLNGPMTIQQETSHSSIVSDEQVFDFEGTRGQIVTTAVFADGSRKLLSSPEEVAYSTMHPNVIDIAGSTVTALASGSGDLVQAVWRAPQACGNEVIETGVAAVTVSIPRPNRITAQLSETVLALPQSTANMIGVETSAVLTVVAFYNDGRVQPLALDNRTEYDFPPNINLVRRSDAVLVSTNSNATVPGNYVISITFTQFPDIQVNVSYSVVSVNDILLTANPYPIYQGSEMRDVQQLSVIGTTSMLQQAIIVAFASLTNANSINITANSQLILTVSTSSQSLQNSTSITDGPVSNILVVSSQSAGLLSISASLREVTATRPLQINVVLTPVHVTAISILPFPSNTFRGLAGVSTRQIVITVTFNDTTQYPNLFQDFFLPNLVVFEASPASSLTIHPLSGLATLRGNSIAEAIVTVSALPPSLVSTSINVACNLDPDFGDVDLGSLSGLPAPPVSEGSTFSIQLRVNSGTTPLDSIEVDVLFDPSIIRAISATEGSDWPSTGQFAFTTDDPLNIVTIGGTLVSSVSVQGTALHLATITFQSVQAGVTNITGMIHTLARQPGDGEIASNIGTVPREIVAGSIQLMVASSRRRRSIISPPSNFDLGVARRTRRQAEMVTCMPQREMGDVDGNCVFDVRDVSFLQRYYLTTVVTGLAPSIPEDRRTYLDADINGEVNANDVVFLLRVNFRLLRFVSDLSFLPVQLTSENCMMEINVTLTSRNDVPAADSSTVLLFDIANENAEFQAMFNMSNVTVGRAVTTEKGSGLYGGLVEASYFGSGVYGIKMESALGQAPFGISPIQVTFDADNMTATFRTAAMFSQSVPLYGSLDANINLRGQGVSISTQLSYAPLLLANSSIDTQTCLRLRSALVFLNSTYSATVSEGVSLGVSVLTVTATSTRPSPVISYSFTSTSPFSIASTSGLITVSQLLDFETTSVYELTVLATEIALSGEIYTDTTSVSIQVVNENDIPPNITQPFATPVLATLLPGSPVSQVEAVDPDHLDPLSFVIDNPAPLFSIDSSTGQISVANSLLDAANTNVLVMVSVMDSIFNSRVVLTFDIYLPGFSQNNYIANISEAAAIGERVVELNIVDTRGDNFIFNLQESPFNLSQLGALTVSSPLDYENQSLYVLNVTAASTQLQLQANVLIFLLDVNDNAPVFSSSSFSVSVSMSAMLGTVVSQLEATDQDSPGPNSDISYSITPTQHSDLFQISKTNGQVAVSLTLFRGPSLVILVIVASDRGTPVMSSSTNLTIEILSTGIPIFPIPPSVSTSGSALALSEPVRVSSSMSSNFTTFEQTFTKLTATTAGQLSASFSGSSKLSSVEFSSGPLLPSSLIANVLHPTSNIYQDSRVITLAFQLRDANYFTRVAQANVQRQVLRNVSSQSILSDSCTHILDTGLCTTTLSIPEEWFDSSSSITVLDSLLNGVPLLSTVEVFNLHPSPILSRSIMSNILVEVPSRDILSGSVFSVNVYGYSPFQITGFSVLFETQGPISIISSVITAQWNFLTTANETTYGITSILTNPGDTSTNGNGNRTFLFTLTVQAEFNLSSPIIAFIRAHIQSLSDVIESSVILDSTSSTSGPALILSRSGLAENGSINIVPNSVQAIYPYIEQPEILNTALLTGTPVSIPVQIFAGYASGEILPFMDDISCSSSAPEVINPDLSCGSLVLTPSETVGSDLVMITYAAGTVSGLLPVRVYAPARPLVYTATDSVLNRIQYTNSSSCFSYQQAELSIFTDFESSSNELISNVSVTNLISPFLVSTDTAVVQVIGITIQGITQGEAMVCIHNRPELGCVALTVSDNIVNVISLVGSVLVEVVLSSPMTLISSSEGTAEIQARSEFRFLQEEADLLVAVQYSDGSVSSVSANEIAVTAPINITIYSLQGNRLVSTGSGEAVGQFQWNPQPGICAVMFTDYFLVSSTLPAPLAIQTSLLASPTVHYLTTSADEAATLVGLPTSLSICVSLLFHGGRTLDVSGDPRVTYIPSTSAISVSNGIITASEGATAQLTVSYAASESNFSVTIELQVVVSTGINLLAHPYPIYPGSSNTNLTSLLLIESTGTWQRAVLQVLLVLSNGTSVDVTSFSQSRFRSGTIPPNQVNPMSEIVVTTLPVLSVGGGSGIIEVVTFFFNYFKTLIIIVESRRILVNDVAVVPFAQDTLRGIRGTTSLTASVDLTFSDGSRFLSYPSNPAFRGQMLAGLVLYSTNSSSFRVNDTGDLQPLVNSHVLVPLRAAAASDNSIFSDYEFYVNLDPDLGDVDIGMRSGSAIPMASTGSQISLPVLVNSGTNNIGSIDFLVLYDPTIIEPVAVTMGPDFGMGIYESSLNDPPGELRVGGAFSSDMAGTNLHLFTINVRFLNPAPFEGSHFQGTVITLATRNTAASTIGLPTPRPMIAGNLTFAVTGRSKRASEYSSPAFPDQLEKHSHTRHRRQAATCSNPPCACSWLTPGDADGNCLFDIRDVSFTLLYINQALVTGSGSDVTPAQMNQLNPNQDGLVDTSDAFFLLRALFRLVYFLDVITVTPVQSPVSECLFSVDVQLRSAQDLPLRAVDVVIDFGFLDNSNYIGSNDTITGTFLTSDKGDGLNGALIQAQQFSDGRFTVRLNATFVASSVGVSVILVTFDASNATSLSRSVQFFGRPPLLYSSRLSLSLNLRETSVVVAASSGYSPFVLVPNTFASTQCSDIPVLGPNLNVSFPSPFQAELSWMLLNLREGLNFSAQLKLHVVTCELNQQEVIVNETCSGMIVYDVFNSSSHTLIAKPFTAYFLQVRAPASATNNTTALSPESPPTGLAPPLYSLRQDGSSFRWALPEQPNGVITHYILYVGSVATYNGSDMVFSNNAAFRETVTVVLEAHNSIGSTQSESIVISPVIGSGPGSRGLSLTAEEAIIVTVILTGIIILVLVIILLCGMWRKRMAMLSRKKPNFLSTNFEPETFEVVCDYL